MWFHYAQNNSGGSFEFDENAGITHHVVIEAKDSSAADEKLKSIGGYFNGCDSGLDCPCCGDRWYEAYGDGDDTPMVYGEPVNQAEHLGKWMPDGKEIAVHHSDGRVEWC